MPRLVNIFTCLFLAAQVNLPLYWHICSETREATFLAVCKDCAPVEQPRSCCEKDARKASGPKVADPAHSCCEIAFAQEHSPDATPGAGAGFHPVLQVISLSPNMAETVFSFGIAHSVPFLVSSGESPPIYLLDSTFRI